jgi:hypothetical protein
VSAASSAYCPGLPARQCERHYWHSRRRRPGSRRERRQRHPRTPPPSSAWMTCPSESWRCSTSTHDPAREERTRGFIYSSNHCAFPPTSLICERVDLGWVWMLTVSNCAHDGPKMALSSSRSALLRATRMDARAMVDGWYSTELITAHSRRDKRSVITAVGFD